jgi:hypothetical protein
MSHYLQRPSGGSWHVNKMLELITGCDDLLANLFEIDGHTTSVGNGKRLQLAHSDD